MSQWRDEQRDKLVDRLRDWAYGSKSFDDDEGVELIQNFAEHVLHELREIQESQKRIEDHLGIKRPDPPTIPLFTKG